MKLIQACVKEFTDTYKNPKILFDAVYPAIAIDPKELTDDCSIAFEILITVLWIPAGTPTSKNLLQIHGFDPKLCKVKLIAALCVMQAPEYQDTGYQLGYNGRNPDACYIQMKTD